VNRARTQAFRQAPWRIARQSTGRTLLGLVALLVLAGMYLAISARLAEAGRELLQFEDRRTELIRETSVLGATLADLTTPKRMLERAASLGFHPAHAKDIEYIVIDGYVPPAGFRAPPPIGSPVTRSGGLSPAYTETLAEWLVRAVEEMRGVR
jgi:hypothetical protein